MSFCFYCFGVKNVNSPESRAGIAFQVPAHFSFHLHVHNTNFYNFLIKSKVWDDEIKLNEGSRVCSYVQ